MGDFCQSSLVGIFVGWQKSYCRTKCLESMDALPKLQRDYTSYPWQTDEILDARYSSNRCPHKPAHQRIIKTNNYD